MINRDGSRLLIGTYRRRAILWDVDAGKTLLTLDHDPGPRKELIDGNTDAVYAVAFSPDGQTLATAGDDHTARLWNLKGELLHKLPHEAVVWYTSFSPDGAKLLTRTSGPSVTARRPCKTRMWDVKTARELWQTESHSTVSLGVSWSPDGKRVAFVTDAAADRHGYDPRATVRDVLTGKEVKPIEPAADAWRSEAAFTRGGSELLISTKEGPALVALETGQIRMRFTGTDPDSDPHAFVSPDGRHIAATGAGGKAVLYDANLPDPILRVTTKPRAEDEEGNDRSRVAFSPDGRVLLVGHRMEEVVEVWELAVGK